MSLLAQEVAGTHTPSAILERQALRESSARTYARWLPIVPVRASGMVIEGADGRCYLDCLSGAGTLALGHNHPVVIEALQAVLQRGAPLHALDIATPEKDDFVSALLDVMPAGLRQGSRVHFCGPAGTDAVEAAIKLAHTATGRHGLLAFTGAYHGMTLGALAATGATAAKERVPGIGADVARMPFPYAYRCPFGIGGAASSRLSASFVERMLDDPLGGIVPPAAMLVEVVQGEGGVIPAPDDWMREMRRITAERGIPLIVDEVQTGVGRTGAMWAVQHSGVVPDVLVLSKAIGGSLPLAVLVYSEQLDVWAPGAHTGTFRGCTLAMAAGAATLRFVVAEELPARAAELGGRIAASLRQLARATDCIGDVRGRGLMLGLEFVLPDGEPDVTGARPAAPALAQRVRSEALARGLIVELGGRHESVLRLLPPLTISDEQADAVVDRLAAAIVAARNTLARARA